MSTQTIVKLIDAIPYAWELVGVLMVAVGFWIISKLDKNENVQP